MSWSNPIGQEPAAAIHPLPTLTGMRLPVGAPSGGLAGLLAPRAVLGRVPQPANPVSPDHDSAAMHTLHALAFGAALAVLGGLADLRPVAHGPGHQPPIGLP